MGKSPARRDREVGEGGNGATRPDAGGETRVMEHPGLIVHEEYRFFGPVPPPALIGAYEQVHPGAAKVIFAAWEKQAEHRQALERQVIQADIRAEWRGMHLAFALAAISVVAGAVLVALDKNAAGIAAILTALATPAGLFLYARHRQMAELRAKAPDSG